jgi:uncharacterized membrane protein
MLLAHLALICAAVFTGAAFYINVVEQPARLTLDDAALLKEWKPAYKHGYAMQAPLAIVGCLLGLAAWWQSGVAWFFVGAVLIVANWPWTLIAMMPTNTALTETDSSSASPQTRENIKRWGMLHGIRTLLGAFATIAFLIGLS